MHADIGGGFYVFSDDLAAVFIQLQGDCNIKGN